MEHMEELAYPIGEQDFRNLREDRCVYIDKTQYIEKLLRLRNRYFFLARPRRFGKSLFLSTLMYFFEGKRELFKGTHIDSYPWDWEEYPVLRLDLNTDKYHEQGRLGSVVDNLFKGWEKKYQVSDIADTYSQRFRNIIESAFRLTGRQVVILVDEYDKPLVGNLHNNENFEAYRAELASLYANFKSASNYIRMVFLTGVSRFSKLSLFSDLNNLNDITFDDRFADICGITEKELHTYLTPGISNLAAKYGKSHAEMCADLKRTYDGYRFSDTGSDIYNPWSLLNCMQKQRLGHFWSLTGVPTIIAETLHEKKVVLERLVHMRCTIDSLNGMDLMKSGPEALMYQTGYLTIKRFDDATNTVELGIPNLEVKQSLFTYLLPYYIDVKGGDLNSALLDLTDAIRDGRPEELISRLDTFLAGIPYEMKMEDENNVQNAMYILLTLIGINAQVEVHTSDGRMDLLIQTTKYVYIIELKYDESSATAHAQIDRKQYDLRFRHDHRTIFKIGVNFSSATRHLDPPQITRLPAV